MCMYIQTHTTQITKKSHESNTLLHPFTIDIAKLQNYLSLGCIKWGKSKRKIFLSTTLLCGGKFQESWYQFLASKDTYDGESIYYMSILLEVLSLWT